MQAQEWVEIARSAYMAETGATTPDGDTLFAFVLGEVESVHDQSQDDAEQQTEIIRALDRAIADLEAVRSAVFSIEMRTCHMCGHSAVAVTRGNYCDTCLASVAGEEA